MVNCSAELSGGLSAYRHAVTILRLTLTDMKRTDWLALWALVIVVSPVTLLAYHRTPASIPLWIWFARLAIVALVFAAGTRFDIARKLRPFCAAYGFLLLVEIVLRTLLASDFHAAFQQRHNFVERMLLNYAVEYAVLIPALIWCARHGANCYLRIGELAAPLQVSGATIGRPALRWRLAAPAFGAGSAFACWLFIRLAGERHPAMPAVLLWAILLAALNAFGEEFLYRNVVTSSVAAEFGATNAALVSATMFGIAHWNGIPYGAPGVAMTFVFGFVAARAMLETRGIFWPWFMHWLPDCVIFYYWAAGEIAHRGGV